MIWKVLLLCILLQILIVGNGSSKAIQKVEVYHLIDNALWGEVDGSAIEGHFPCGALKCEVVSSTSKDNHFDFLKKLYVDRKSSMDSASTLTVGLYNIHTWGTYTKWPHPPDVCSMPVNFTMAESEESHARFSKLFDASFVHFDGNSTTSPFASVPRTYFRGLKTSDLLVAKPFSSMIKAASFVASTCHRGDSTTKRISLLQQLQKSFRVDSLGKCQHTKHVPEGITLGVGKTAQESLQLKQAAISNYLFYLAFENSYERGYVTEKVFDALIAGVVPVYLGSSVDCKALLPHPKAAIFLDDFQNNMTAVAAHLEYLSHNESAYEEHRLWRKSFDPENQSVLFKKSWPCRICEWAVHQSRSPAKKKKKSCPVFKT